MKRFITGLLVIAGWLSLLYSQSFLLFWLAVSIISLLGLHEYFTICLDKEGKQLRFMFIASALAPLLASYFKAPDVIYALLVLSLLVNACLVVFSASILKNPFDLLLKASFGSIYLGFFPAFLVLFMALPQGVFWLLFLTTITAASDTGAYFFGKSLGRKKLCPSISPGKTREGFIGGLFCGSACALLVAFIFLDGPNVPLLAGTAVLLSALGVIGDLVESLLKRSMGAKDSGSILPGHGGILDRVDSLLLTAPLLYFMVIFNLLG
ncbi:MAG: phosphatidate cytidylyltransferase [Desulfobulbaceae bacterium]|nr:phosphatidate cytidylyltransferase [Desulfobulbaceae bacterium]